MPPLVGIPKGQRPLGVLLFELLHEVNQLDHAFAGHGVVDAGAHTAHGAVALQIHKACLGERTLELRELEGKDFYSAKEKLFVKYLKKQWLKS